MQKSKVKSQKFKNGCQTLVWTFLFLAPCFLLQPVAAEEPPAAAGAKELKITLLDLRTYEEYRDVLNGLKKITGVSDLVPAKMSSGVTTLNGKLSSDPAMFKNDMQAFATDRFKLDKKENKDKIEITLKKL